MAPCVVSATVVATGTCRGDGENDGVETADGSSGLNVFASPLAIKRFNCFFISSN